MSQDVREQLKQGESADLELERTLSDDGKIIETIAAMATIGGGTILVGVRDDGTPIGVELGEGARERFVQRAMAAIDPKVFLDIDEPVVDGKQLLRSIRPVKPCSASAACPCTIRG
ncbi:MAG: AlbA family DNA-binding domain-containing protein [Myxococcota bacterium]